MFYAQINENNIVTGISELSGEVIQANLIEIANYDESLLGKLWNGTAFITSPNTNTYLHIDLPANPITSGTTINATVTVKDAANTFVPVTQTYYVPVVRNSDKLQGAFLTIAFTNGTANLSFSLANPGIYTIDMNLIEPKPSSILQNNIVLIVI